MKEILRTIVLIILTLIVMAGIIVEVISCVPFWFSGRSIFDMPWYCVSR